MNQMMKPVWWVSGWPPRDGNQYLVKVEEGPPFGKVEVLFVRWSDMRGAWVKDLQGVSIPDPVLRRPIVAWRIP